MKRQSAALERLGLARNPFPPATTGASIGGDILPPESWQRSLTQLIHQLAESQGDKALAIEGGYGSGKTFLLRWIETKVLPSYRVKPYFFENPGVSFYDLANTLMRQVGRYELAKALWEKLYKSDNPEAVRERLFPLQFGQWLVKVKSREPRERAIHVLSKTMKEQDLATDEEIINKLSRLVVETGERPYFEYRDFVPRNKRSFVPEREEARFFRALIRILLAVYDAEGVAFLVDEFEDVALDRRLSRRQASEYIATMRRLLDTARDEDLWVILSATPEGLERTRILDPSLNERFGDVYRIPGLTKQEAYELVEQHLRAAWIGEGEGISPFSENSIESLTETTRSNPRRLIKVMWRTIGLASERSESAPLAPELVQEADRHLYLQDLNS